MTVKGSIQTILRGLKSIGGVVGSAVVSKEGLIIGFSFPKNFDPVLIGAMVSSMDASAESVTLELQKSSPESILVKTDSGFLLVNPVGAHLLVVLADKAATIGILMYESVKAGDKLKKILSN